MSRHSSWVKYDKNCVWTITAWVCESAAGITSSSISAAPVTLHMCTALWHLSAKTQQRFGSLLLTMHNGHEYQNRCYLCVGYTITQTVGYTITNTQSVGYTITDTQTVGYTITNTQSVGYTITDTQSVGYTITDTQSVGYTITNTTFSYNNSPMDRPPRCSCRGRFFSQVQNLTDQDSELT